MGDKKKGASLSLAAIPRRVRRISSELRSRRRARSVLNWGGGVQEHPWVPLAFKILHRATFFQREGAAVRVVNSVLRRREEVCRWRPYRDEYTGSPPNSGVSRRRARSVLTWGTVRERPWAPLTFNILYVATIFQGEVAAEGFFSPLIQKRSIFLASGHTATSTPDLFRTPKLTVARPGQY